MGRRGEGLGASGFGASVGGGWGRSSTSLRDLEGVPDMSPIPKSDPQAPDLKLNSATVCHGSFEL